MAKEHTLIVTLPDGSTAERRTGRLYLFAIVARFTEAEAVAAEQELQAARDAVTPELRASWEKLVAELREVEGLTKVESENRRVEVDRYFEARNKGEDAAPPPPPDRRLWDRWERLVEAVRRHPLWQIEEVEGVQMLNGAPLVKRAAGRRANVGKVEVVTWNQRRELSDAALAAERGRYPLRELQIVPTRFKPPAARKAKA